MGSPIRMNFLYLVIFTYWISFTACASGPEIRSQKSNILPQVGNIFIEQPIIEFRNVKNNALLEVPHDDYVRLCQSFTSAIYDDLARKKINFSGIGDGLTKCSESSDIHELYRITKITKENRKEDEQQKLSDFLNDAEGTHVLLTRVRFYVGEGGYWNPFGGQIASDNSRLVLDSQIFDLLESKIVWQNAKQLRIRSNAREKAFGKIVRDLLEPLISN